MKNKYYYIECDGRIYLEEDEYSLSFPTKRELLHFKIDVIQKMPIEEADVYFSKPLLSEFPAEWLHKDDVFTDKRTSRIVKLAVCKSYIRPTVSAVVLKKDRILMVKANRGITEGRWNLPSGFVDYSEHPEQTLIRELKEELGVDIKDIRFLKLYSGIGKNSGYHIISLVYTCDITEEKFELEKDEIDLARYIPLNEVRLINPYFEEIICDVIELHK